MIIKDREIKLTFKTRQMIEIGEKIGGQYELEMGAYKNDLKTLGTLISVFSGSLDYNASLDLIDELLDEGITVRKIYEEIFKEINAKAFFTKPLEITDSVPINTEAMTDEIMKQAQTDFAKKLIEEQTSENTLIALEK